MKAKMPTEEYYANIDSCAENKIDKPIPNGLAEHAVYLMTKMLSYATQHVRLFTGELADSVTRNNGDTRTVLVYSDPKLIEAAKNFLQKEGSVLDILVQEDSGNIGSRQFVQTIKTMKANGEIKGSINIRKAGLEAMSLENHFILMDEIGFRLETDHKNTKAIANFRNEKVSLSLADTFDNQLFKNGSVLLAI